MVNQFQYVIIGAGSAGLQLAKGLLDMKKPKAKSILLIDQSDVMIDKTWCFWCHPDHHYKSLVKKDWKNIAFKAQGNRIEESVSPMTYQYIQSKEFYNFHREIFSTDKRIEHFIGTVKKITFTDIEAVVHFDQQTISAEFVFCTNPALLTTENLQPTIWQHFIGWTIECPEACFHTETFTMMDFDVEDNAELQFMYVLPLTNTKALIECTVFSENIHERETYEKNIRRYIEKNFTQNYQIIDVEVGKIPMQLPINYKHLNKRIIPIGTAAGCVKASTGYSFIRNMENTVKIITSIEKHLNHFKIRRNFKFEFYDSLLLYIIETNPKACLKVFNALFKNNEVKVILKFLDEKTTILEDIKIFWGLPKLLFLNALGNKFARCLYKAFRYDI